MANDDDGKKITYTVGVKPSSDQAKVEIEGGKAQGKPEGTAPVYHKEVDGKTDLDSISRSKGTSGVPDTKPNVATGESVGAKGYNPSGTPQVGGTRPPLSDGKKSDKDGQLEGKKEGGEPVPAPEGGEGRKESAPDVGKDYGSPPPTNNGQEPQTNFGPGYNGGGVGGKKPKTEPTPEKGDTPPVTPPGEQPTTKQDGLEKKDGLDEKKDGDKPEKQDGDKPEKKDGEKPEQKDKKKDEDKDKKEEPAAPAPAPRDNGNGYGAIQQKRPGAPTQQQNNQPAPQKDSTAAARKRHGQNQKAANAKAKERGLKTGKASSGSINTKASPSLGQRFKNWGKNLLKKKTGLDNGGKSGGQQVVAGITGLVKSFLLRHPFVILIIAFVILVLIVILDETVDKSKNGSRRYCSYDVSGVISTGNVKLDNVQVELINCDGNAQNYRVLETIDFEKYVVGVALAEVSWHSDNPDYFKAQILAARGFALKRNSSMCPGHPDNCFYGYNAETGKIRLRACTNDQVYCDIDKPCYHVLRDGQPTIYGPEAEGMAGATVWKGQLSEETKAQILAAAEDVRGKVLVDNNGDVVFTNFVNTDQQNWWKLTKEQGMDYEQALITHYADKNASGLSTGVCSNYGNIDYGDYELSSEGDTILNERLDRFLERNGTSLEEFNQLIVKNVEKNGYGTRAGVVAAAVTLIAELGNNYDIKVPYFLSGGHHDGVKTGAVGYWGSGYEDDGRRCYYTGYGNIYTVCGLDCSGFVPWAIKNGGFQMSVNLASNFQNLDGARRVTLDPNKAVLLPGDLLESSGHVVLVVGVDETTHQYICAEASGKNSGVLFTRRSFADSGYWGVQMDEYYEKYSLKGK